MTKLFQRVLTISLIIAGSIFIEFVFSSVTIAAQVHGDSINETAVPTKDIKTEVDFGQWMTYYYLYPQPDLAVKAIFFAEQKGMLDGDYPKEPFAAFLGQIFAHNPTKLPIWIGQLKSLRQPHKILFGKLCGGQTLRKQKSKWQL
jgi:hypothetical protein